MNTITNISQSGHGTYKVTILDDHGDTHTVKSHDVETIDAIREAGRDMKSNDDGTYERLRSEFADSLAAMHNN